MGDQLDFLQRELGDIAEVATNVNEGTHQVDDVVDEGHEVLVGTAGTLDEAKVEMQEGNKDLVVAEDDQSSSSKIIWIILGVVVTIVVIVGVVLGLKFGGVF
jgi:t-SNARE complex subunit (syntaxin)